ncbi:hypothetical protein AMC87_CH02906 [Rhizobium phaseoli]|uniref:hypothetical protein n=1 Tax=Rhizobium phaseoli TaxID=396 RepID=UPI0007EC212F|nr:hypothetical protein [Rhizobium phaseoli]ANL47571.1 hypothetical protein AMC87_CH02906 [Rhizobium phaseoli]
MRLSVFDVSKKRDRVAISRHLFPTHVTVYRDGYTTVSRAACDPAFQTEFRDIALELENTHLRPYSVTCRRCLKTKTYREAVAAYETNRLPAYVVNQVPRMRHEVYRQQGVYDVEENNLVRQWLGIQPVFPTRAYLDALMEDEERIHEGYRQDRERSKELDRQLAEMGIKGDVQITRRRDLLKGKNEEEIIVNADNVPLLPSTP